MVVEEEDALSKILDTRHALTTFALRTMDWSSEYSAMDQMRVRHLGNLVPDFPHYTCYSLRLFTYVSAC